MLGLTIPATNLVVAQASPDRSAAALNVLNLAWGIGAAAWPFLSQGGGSTPLLLLGAALALNGMALGKFLPGVASGGGAATAATPARDPALGSGDTPRGRRFLVFALLFFFYVGTENAVGGWVASLARRLVADGDAGWTLMPSLFWAALLLGRALAPAVLARVAEATLAASGLLLAALGMAVLLGAASLRGVGAGVAFAGLGLASVFPIVIALMTREFASGASRVAGWMFALAGLGGATLPWLVGIVSTGLGGLAWGLMVPLVSSLGMAAVLRGGGIRQRPS